MTDLWEQAVDDLATTMRINRHGVVPFIGAGISEAAGLPSWRSLASTLLDVVHGLRLGSTAGIAAARAAAPLAGVTYARRELGEEMFRRQVAKVLASREGAAPPRAAQLCWRLNEQFAVTTNLDEVLEHAAAKLDGRAARSLTPKDALTAALIEPDRRVLHLHGTLSRFDTWVMAEADYAAATAPTSPVGAVLQTVLLSRVVLFVGYSCDDPDLNVFLERFKSHFGAGSLNHYALVSDLTDAGRRRLIEYGIVPVAYTPSSRDHPEVPQFLEAVLTRFDPMAAERIADDQRRHAPRARLTSVAELRTMGVGERRDALDAEFAHLYDEASNHALVDTSELPPAVRARRTETLDVLAGAWQVGSDPPHNAIDGREVIRPLGEGGFGVVWKVENVLTHEAQALKIAHFQATTNFKFVERFKQGIRAMQRLTNHGVANTTRYHGHREVPLCVFMDYVDGGDLGLLVKGVALEARTRLRLASEIATIVADAHAIPVYHRDLKPSNVLVRWDRDAEPHAVLSDFDLAWYEGAISRTTTQMGDQAFASPEQLREARTPARVRGESDVYSLGMLLYFLVSCQTPSAGQWYNQHLDRDVRNAARHFRWRSVERRIADLVVRCARELPSDRPTARAVAGELRQLHAMETTGNASAGEFIEEVRLRLREDYADPPAVAVEQRREHGRAVVQATYSRGLREYDDRSRFKPQGDRSVKALRSWFETHRWSVHSVSSTSTETRVVVHRDLDERSVEFAESVARDVGGGAESWSPAL